MNILSNIQNNTNYFFKGARIILAVILLSSIIAFCMLNSEVIGFKIPILPYIVYMPLFLVILIAPIILKILRIFLSLLIK